MRASDAAPPASRSAANPAAAAAGAGAVQATTSARALRQGSGLVAVLAARPHRPGCAGRRAKKSGRFRSRPVPHLPARGALVWPKCSVLAGFRLSITALVRNTGAPHVNFR